MNVFYANCRYENWDACKANEIFGLKGKRLPDIEPGDLILLRVTGHTGEPYGVKALWRLKSIEAVGPETQVPWHDAKYSWILHCYPLLEFATPLSEEFATSSKISQKIDSLYATRIMGSIGALKYSEAINYLELIINEKSTEINSEAASRKETPVTRSYLLDVVAQLKSDSGSFQTRDQTPAPINSPSIAEPLPSYGVVGERIDLPVLNYAPLNEMGVILLFGYYLRDLGFSHLEEIRSVFPDAIGMQRVDDRRYRRVRIEFEFMSKNFRTHGHQTQNCDVIVCWEDNWPECPLEVIELKSALFGESE